MKLERRFCQNLLQRNAALRREFAAIFILGRNIQDVPVEAGDFHAHRPERSFHDTLSRPSVRRRTLDCRTPSVVVSRNSRSESFSRSAGLHKHVTKLPGAIFFHLHGNGENIQGSRLQRALGEIAINLRIHVVEIGFQDDYVFFGGEICFRRDAGSQRSFELGLPHK